MFNAIRRKLMGCPSKCSFVSRLEDMGRARQFLEGVLDNEVFEKTSKHHPYWESEHEIEGGKLDDLRMTIGYLQDNLWELMQILRPQENNE